MRAASILALARWRWAPCVALVVGSLGFVLLAFAIIPDHIGTLPARGRNVTTSSNALRPSPYETENVRPVEPSSPSFMNPAAPPALRASPVDHTGSSSNVVQSLFPTNPPMALPVAPPDPAPPPPPEPPPPPAPTATIDTPPVAPSPPPPEQPAPSAPPEQPGPQNHP